MTTGHSLSSSEIIGSNSPAAHEPGKRRPPRALIPFGNRSETSAGPPQCLAQSITREIEFYQVLRRFFTGESDAEAQNYAELIAEETYETSHSASELDKEILFVFFIASLCFICVTGDTPFGSIQGAYHHNVVAGL